MANDIKVVNVPKENLKTFPIIEIFGPTIQGEGGMIGSRSHFIRLGGCSYRCSWCDSMHAVDPKRIKQNARYLNTEQIVREINELSHAQWVTISGGDPCQHNILTLVENLKKSYNIAIETQGAFFKDWLEFCTIVTISPKPPSSGMSNKLNNEILQQYVSLHLNPSISTIVLLKIVVMNQEDLEWAAFIRSQYPMLPAYLTVGTEIKHKSQQNMKDQICHDMKWLFEASMAFNIFDNVCILPQLHVLAWGPELER